MPRYIYVAAPVGLVYGDTRDEPGPDPATPVEGLRRIDAGIGETDLSYDLVERDDPSADIHAYTAAGTARAVADDATYVASYRVRRPDAP